MKILLVFTLACFVTACSTVAAKNSGIEASLVVVEREIILHQPITLKFVVENKTDSPISLDLGDDYRGNFLFTVIGPEGRIDLPPHRKLDVVGGISAGPETLQPGKKHSQTLFLNDWFRPTVAGKYTLEGRLQGVPPFRAEFRVVAASDLAVKELCESYLDRVENGSAQTAFKTLVAMSYFDSPAAVQCMTKALLSKKMSSFNMIISLRKQKTKTAAMVLLNIIENHPESEAAKFAKGEFKFN